MTHRSRTGTLLGRLLFAALLSVTLLGTTAPLLSQVDPTTSEEGETDERIITGIVLDGDTDEGIAGASIEVVRFDETGKRESLGVGTAADVDGRFRLVLPKGGNGLRISSIGYDPITLRVTDADENLSIRLWSSEPNFEPIIEIAAQRRSRSIEDGCCRVESINEEVQQHAPFSPSPIESLQRYSSCTFGRTINTIDGLGVIGLRGLEPTRFGLLIDGAPLYTGLGTYFGATIVPSHALQTVRIAEGASNGAYGDEAVAGVVALETRLPTEEAEIGGSLNLLGGGPEPDQIDLNLGYTGILGDLGIALFGSFNEHASSSSDDVALLERDYRRASGMAKGNLLVDDRTELVFSLLGGIEERRGAVTQSEIGDLERTIDVGRLDAILSLSRLVGTTGEIRLKGAASLLDVDIAEAATTVDADQRTLFAEGTWSGLLGDHDVTIGLQARTEDLTSTERPDLAYDSRVLSLFAQDVLPIGSRFSALASLRADHHDVAGLLLSPRAALSYALSDDVSMRVMAGQGFKAEGKFDEDYRTLFGSLRWRQEESFDFERSLTLNYDVNWTWIPSTSFGLDGNVNFYITRIDDKFVANPDSLAVGTLLLQNATEPARLLGFEWQTRATFADGWNASLALGIMDYRQRDAGGEYEPVPFAPNINIDGLLGWRNQSIGLVTEAWGSLVGPQNLPTLASQASERSPTYALLNFRAEKELGVFGVFAGVLNILDAKQTETDPLVRIAEGRHDGSIGWGPFEGREFFIGVRLRITEE